MRRLLLCRALSTTAPTSPSTHIVDARVSKSSNAFDTLELERIDVDLYRSRRTWVPPGARGIFGGAVIGQALIAAHASRADASAPLHSFHSYFLAPGDPSIPILYAVKRLRDGRSFQSRHISAMQHGKPIFHGMASFHVAEEAEYQHQFDMPEAPPPDDLPSMRDVQRNLLKSDKIPTALKNALAKQMEEGMPGFPIDIRYCDASRGDPLHEVPRPPRQMVWMRSFEPLGDDEHLHQCLAAYASDWSLCTTALLPSGSAFLSPRVKLLTSLDHTIWMHSKFRFDDWLLYEMESPWAGAARGVSFGRIFTKDGKLAMSVAQEALMRLHSRTRRD